MNAPLVIGSQKFRVNLFEMTNPPNEDGCKLVFMHRRKTTVSGEEVQIEWWVLWWNNDICMFTQEIFSATKFSIEQLVREGAQGWVSTTLK